MRVNPETFDKLLTKIKDDPVFHNNSHNPQLPVAQQLAITLYRFGHDGNSASQPEMARWAGGGDGSVSMYTKRVMKAVLHRSFMDEAVRMPTEDEKEDAKMWVEAHSCKAWRDGWCLVDGTLIPLYDRPNWYGESYFDRKCNYSLNFQVSLISLQYQLGASSLTFAQVINLPNLHIIDFSFGHTGSTQNSTAWDQTYVAQNHEEVLEDGEWVWADSAYPVCFPPIDEI